MIETLRVVPQRSPHTHKLRGDPMEKKPVKYDATYQLGKTTVHVVAPPERTPEEIEMIHNEIRSAIWAIIDEQAEREGEAATGRRPRVEVYVKG